jgi:glutathione peroxidase
VTVVKKSEGIGSASCRVFLKKLFFYSLVLGFLFSRGVSMADQESEIYRIETKTIDGEGLSFSKYKGSPILFVNTASQCGFTTQYSDLQALYEEYKAKGLVVVGTPCNQFGQQEPGSNVEIKKFCELKYRVHFPLLAKGDVNGPHQHPLYHYLISHSEDKSPIRWNFEKFLVNRKGEVVARFNSATTPRDPKLISAVEEVLK